MMIDMTVETTGKGLVPFWDNPDIENGVFFSLPSFKFLPEVFKSSGESKQLSTHVTVAFADKKVVIYRRYAQCVR